MSQVSQPIKIKKEFKLQARRFHIVANEKVLPKLETVLQYIMSRQYVYILCRKGINKRGKEHAHIYVAFERPVRLSTRNTHGCYLAKCRGDSKQNVTYINDHHPEWILAWKQIGYESLQGTRNVDRVTFSSRLKRNLNSGDRIVFALNSFGALQDLALLGMCQFWTCAN